MEQSATGTLRVVFVFSSPLLFVFIPSASIKHLKKPNDKCLLKTHKHGHSEKPLFPFYTCFCPSGPLPPSLLKYPLTTQPEVHPFSPRLSWSPQLVATSLPLSSPPASCSQPSPTHPGVPKPIYSLPSAFSHPRRPCSND